MDIVYLLVVGGVIGWLASILMKTNAQMGLAMNILVGIGGAYLGGKVIAPALGISVSGTLGLILVGIGGAAVVILVLRALKVLK